MFRHNGRTKSAVRFANLPDHFNGRDGAYNSPNALALNPLDTSAFFAPFNDLGNGEVNLVLTRGTGSATFTRATAACTRLSDGTLKFVASGVPRSNYSAAGVYLGYLAEGARTNRCLYSQNILAGQRGVTPPWLSTAIASELVTNGDFAGGATGWTVGGSVSIAAGVATFTTAAVGTDHLSQVLTGTAATDKVFKVVYDVTGYAAGSIRYRFGQNQFGTVRSADGTYTEYVAMPDNVDSMLFEFYVQTTFTGSIDNISVTKMAMQTYGDVATAPDGTTTACVLAAAAANATLIQDLGVVASAAKAGGLWLKRKTGTGNVDLTLNGGTNWTTQTINSSTWTRCELTATLADEDFGIRIVTSGDEVYAWQGQVETCAAGTPAALSSDIATTTVAVARNADSDTYATAGNFSDTAGALYAEVTYDVWANAVGSIVGSATQGMMPLATNNGVKGYDGTNTVNGTAGVPSGTVKMAISWSGTTMKVCGNGTAVVSGTYDGAWNLATIGIGIGSFAKSKNVRAWTSALTDNQMVSITTP